MTSVLHPLIADIAPARSTTRPDAPAREPRRDNEKFSVPDAPQATRDIREIPDTPVRPISPIRAHQDLTPETSESQVPAHLADAAPASETDTANPVPTLDTATPPATPAGPFAGLIASISGAVSGNNAIGQATAAAEALASEFQNPAVTTAAGQSNSIQANPHAGNAQVTVSAASIARQTSGAATAGQADQPVSPATPTTTAPGAIDTQPPPTAQQIAAAANTRQTGPGGTTPSSTISTKAATAAAKSVFHDQKQGEVEVDGPASGNNGKKTVTAFATGASGAVTAGDTTAKPSLPQASTQILAQAMANAPAIAAATPDPALASPTTAAPAIGDTPGVTQSFSAEMRAAIDAPTQAAAYTARGAVTAQPAAEQIAMQISRAADQNIDRMTVHLKPAELGKVTINLEVGPDNRLLAVISAERSETLDLLQRDAKSLERALNDAGVKTDSGSLEFNLKGEGGTAENGRDGDGKLNDGAVMLPGDIDATTLDSTLTNTPIILPEGRIDIQV